MYYNPFKIYIIYRIFSILLKIIREKKFIFIVTQFVYFQLLIIKFDQNKVSKIFYSARKKSIIIRRSLRSRETSRLECKPRITYAKTKIDDI